MNADKENQKPPVVVPMTSSPRRSRVSRLLSSFRSSPGYTLMRGAARFSSARGMATYYRKLSDAGGKERYLADCRVRMSQTQFPDIDIPSFSNTLREEGMAPGLSLSATVVDAIHRYAESAPCYADRNEAHGFHLNEQAQASASLGKPVLLAQYFNAISSCPEIARLVNDPVLQAIACEYLESVPRFVGANLWWTFPVDASEEDRELHAHLFHRDVDDFRFFKFFFYLTDVERGDGGHVCVLRSHRSPPRSSFIDQWNIRRYSDEEISRYFPASDILEICGPAGTGFAENTLCVHKGRTPTRHPRLLLQLQFALFDYGAMHDRRDPSRLRSLT